MLILTRKPGQSFTIGDATVTVIEVQGQTVRIGIDAPRETLILRTEVPDRNKYTETPGSLPSVPERTGPPNH